MELKWLEDFVVLARTASFSQAARERNVTQPAFSRRIRSLEHWLGVSLVDRSTLPMSLTHFGEEFLPQAQDMIATSTAIRQDFRMAARAARMQVRIVTLHTLAVHVVPELTARFLSDNPLTSVEIIPSLQGVDSYFEALSSGLAQIVIAYAQHRPLGAAAGDLVSTTIMQDEFVPVVVPAMVAQVHKGGRWPIVRYTPFNFSHTLMSAVYDQIEEHTTVRAESTLGETLKALALAGVGVAWVPRFSVRAELASGALTVLPDPSLRVPIEVMAWRRRGLEEGHARALFDSLTPDNGRTS